jgi:N-acetylmuramoyl-L-alanine amidase
MVVVASAAFRLQSDTTAAPAGVAPVPPDRGSAADPAPPTLSLRVQPGPPLDTPLVRPAVDPQPPAAAADQGSRQELRADSEPNRDRRRWRRRNRYPGPIPTPAEWEPPEGPVRVALQAGHWRADEAPAELAGLRGNGTRAHGRAEWEINLDIARRAGAMLEEMGYQVEILPAVVPPSYRAHLFISIHADGSADPKASGYRVAAPRRDATGRASRVAELLERTYGEATGLKLIPTVTRRMGSYYAFNFRRYEHALHPMTIGVILETGFLTSPTDRGVIVSDPDRAARGIVAAVAAFEVTPPPAKAAVTAGSGPG